MSGSSEHTLYLGSSPQPPRWGQNETYQPPSPFNTQPWDEIMMRYNSYKDMEEHKNAALYLSAVFTRSSHLFSQDDGAGILLKIGASFFLGQEFDQAILYFSEILGMKDEDEDGGETYLKTGRWRAFLLSYRGRARRYNSQPNLAILDFNEALRLLDDLSKEAAIVLINRARCYLDTEQLSLAIEDFALVRDMKDTVSSSVSLEEEYACALEGLQNAHEASAKKAAMELESLQDQVVPHSCWF